MESTFNNLLSLKEAADIWHLEESTLRKAISNKRFIVNEDVKKFGKQWVIKKESMEREYGRLKFIPYDKPLSEFSKQCAYHMQIDCFYNYAKKNKLSYKKTLYLFNKYHIFDLLFENYEYFDTQQYNITLKEISSLIRRGIDYVR